MIKILKKSEKKLVILTVLSVTLVVCVFFIDNYYLFGLLTLIIALESGYIFKNTFNSLKRLIFGADFLRGIGIIFLYFYTFALTLFPTFELNASRHMLYVGISVIIVLIELLKFKRSCTEKSYFNIVDEFKKIKIEKVNKFENNKIHETEIEKIKIGDIIEIKSGEIIPVDGIIISGETLINEKIITGNTEMIIKKNGDEVAEKSTNLKNRILIKVTQIADDSTTKQIEKLINEIKAEESDKQIKNKNREKFLGIIFLLISIGLFVFWYKYTGSLYIAFLTSCSVLFIVSPENFFHAINIPTQSILNKASLDGIIFKGGDVLQLLNQITRIIFNKRRVITDNNPEITNIIPKEAFNEKRFLILLGSLESLSAHPFAQAISDYCEREEISFKKVSSYKIIEGMGIIGHMDNQEIIVGSKKLMEESKVQMKSDLIHKALVMSKNVRSPIFVARNRELIGLVGVGEKIKENVKEAIYKLRKNYELTLITGDDQTVTESIAKEIIIKDFIACLDEKEKKQSIKDYKEDKDIVAFIGNGKDDSDLLNEADIGISIGAFSEVHDEQSDITILNDDLRQLVKVFNYAKEYKQKIDNNFKLITLYHIFAIPLAAGILFPLTKLLMHPFEAALLMFLSFLAILYFSLKKDKSDSPDHP